MKFLTLIFELFVGKYADALSAVLGLVGALAFAKAPIESLNSRRALLQILTLTDVFDKPTIAEARATLVAEAEDLLETERRWNLGGALSLAASFLILLAHYSQELWSAQ
jgi:hypothetical protein